MTEHSRHPNRGPWVRLQCNYRDDPAIASVGPLTELIFLRMIALCGIHRPHGILHARFVRASCSDVRGLAQKLTDLEDAGLIRYMPETQQWLIVNWSKYNMNTDGVSAGNKSYDLPEDQRRSSKRNDAQASHTRARVSVQGAPPPVRSRDNDTSKALLKEQSRALQELPRVAPPTPSPPPPGGGAAEAGAGTGSLGRESEDQEPEPPPPMTQAQRNPRLAGVDGADEIVPDWRDLANRQVASPERVSEILAGVREMLGQRNAKRREQERENLSEETFETRRQGYLRALEAAYPEIRQSQNGEIH